MNNIYEALGLPRVINANGKMTYLGTSTLSDSVINAFSEASKNYVVVSDLLKLLGKNISTYTKAESTCITSSAAAGLAISTAALIARDNLTAIESLPFLEGAKNKIVIPKGHVVNFGAPIKTMVALGGGQLIEAGQANQVTAEHIETAITPDTCGILYIKSHHCVQKGILSPAEIVEVAHRNNLPVIIDAAAEEDLQKYVKTGADMVIYSGAKALNGPTSGFITGKKEYIDLCMLQTKGIGRAMKVSKESAVALYQAIKDYFDVDTSSEVKRQKDDVEYLVNGLKLIKDLNVSVEQDDQGREIYRVRVQILPSSSKNAFDIAKELKEGNISIHTRDYYINTGLIYIDPRALVSGDKELIIDKFKKIMEY